MGSGSSRSGRALKRLRGPDRRPAGPGGAASEGGAGPLVSATAVAGEEALEAVAEAAEGAAGPDSGPDAGAAAPPDTRDETLRLLDQLLAESAAWDPGELASRGPARARLAAGAGSRVSVAAPASAWSLLPAHRARARSPRGPPALAPGAVLPLSPCSSPPQLLVILPPASSFRGASLACAVLCPLRLCRSPLSCRLRIPPRSGPLLPLGFSVCLLWVLVSLPPVWGDCWVQLKGTDIHTLAEMHLRAFLLARAGQSFLLGTVFPPAQCSFPGAFQPGWQLAKGAVFSQPPAP